MTKHDVTRGYVDTLAAAGWRDALASVQVFDDWLRARGRSQATRAHYVAAARRWWRYATSTGAGNDADSLAAWLRVRRGVLSLSAMNVEIAALRAWNAWALVYERPGLVIDGLDAFRIKRPPARLVRYLDMSQVDALLASIPETWQGVRDRTIIALMFDAGLRPGEVANLELGDILAEGYVFVRAGKGRRDRYAPVSARMLAELDGWIQRRREARPGKRSVLFVTRAGRPLRGARAVWAIVRRYTAGSGASPRWLRAGMATELLRRGCPVTAVADMLGHERVETTARYTDVDLRQMRAAIEHHPRHRRPPSDS